MKLIKQSVYVAAASTILIGLSAAPVFAERGPSRTVSDDVATTTATTVTTPTDDHGNGTRTTDEMEQEDTARTQFKLEAQKKVSDMRKAGQEKSQAAREESCNTHKNGAEQRIKSVSTNAARFQTKLDTIFTKTQAYVTDNKLTVANYDTLVASVTSAQKASATSIATLTSLQPSIDCTQTTNAENVAAFRTAAQDSRDKLKAYMRSLKDLLKAVRDTKNATNTTTQTETDGSSN